MLTHNILSPSCNLIVETLRSSYLMVLYTWIVVNDFFLLCKCFLNLFCMPSAPAIGGSRCEPHIRWRAVSFSLLWSEQTWENFCALNPCTKAVLYLWTYLSLLCIQSLLLLYSLWRGQSQSAYSIQDMDTVWISTNECHDIFCFVPTDFIYRTILLASVIYCSNEFYQSTQQHGHVDHLLDSETQRWINKI